MKYLFSFSMFVLLSLVMVLPQVGFAQEGSIMSAYQGALDLQAAQLVTCTGYTDCNFCSFGEMVNNIINWLFGILTVLAVVIMAWAGIKLVTSGGNQEAMRWAKERIVYVIIGFLLMLTSWLIIDTILRGLTGSEKGMNYWGSFDVENCGFVRTPQGVPYGEHELEYVEGGIYDLEGPEGVSLDGAVYTGDHACPNCMDMSTFISCKSNCSTDREYAERLAGLARVSATTLEVTEGYPPTRTHQAQCHSNGTCVDIVFQDRVWTAERVKAFEAQASALGFRAVYEPGPGQSCLGSSNCLTGYATGNHFSLYAN